MGDHRSNGISYTWNGNVHFSVNISELHYTAFSKKTNIANNIFSRQIHKGKIFWKFLGDMAKTILENSKKFPAPCLQSVNLRMSLKLSEQNVSYHCIRILFMKGSFFCVYWMYIGRCEDVQNVFWTSYVRSIYVLFPGGKLCQSLATKPKYLIIWFTFDFLLFKDEWLLPCSYLNE